VAVEEVALGEAGDVYVADKNNNRVEWFSPEGKELKGQFNGHETPAKSFASPTAIAIDNSTNPLDPSAGDVYVLDSGHNTIDKFEADGKYLTSITTGASGEPFSELYGVAVDPEGLLWVYQSTGQIDDYTSAATNTFLSSRPSPYGTSPGFAVDAEDNLYVNRGSGEIAKLNSSGEDLIEGMDRESSTAVAVDVPSGETFVDNGTSIATFGAEPSCSSTSHCSSGTPLERFGSGELTEGAGVAVDASRGLVYVADASADAVALFKAVTVPTPATGGAVTPLVGAVTLEGTVNPEGVPVTTCEFEYGLTSSYGSTAPCAQSPGNGTVATPVSAQVTVAPGHTYHYRLVAANANGSASGSDRTFKLGAKATIEEETVVQIASTEATLSAQVDPDGFSTNYYVEYGPTPSYGMRTPELSAGAGEAAGRVQVTLSGLTANTTYHARFVAVNAAGPTQGLDLTYSTTASASGASAVLPDHRVYELVSPTTNVDVYQPNVATTGITSDRPSRASAEGNALAFIADPATSGGSGSQGNGDGDEYLATRTPQGWSAKDIVPAGGGLNTQYVGLSSDLSVGIVESLQVSGAAPCDTFFSRTADGSVHPFFTEQVGDSCGPTGNNIEEAYAGASADYSHLLYQSAAALTPGAVEPTGEREYNLYVSVGGHLTLVNVLPGTNPEPDPDATFGGPHGEVGAENDAASFENDISADGSRIFWTDMKTGLLYLRENGTRTIPVSAGAANFWKASSDGAYAFYTEAGRLWRFAVNRFLASDKPEPEALSEAREPLTEANAAVQGIVGINESGEDGASIYLVADEVLASNENSGGATATQGDPNLYLDTSGSMRYIATLLQSDSEFGGPMEDQAVSYGDWEHNAGERTAEITPDGHAVAFMSRAQLTSYKNLDEPEVYVYDAANDQLDCASCNPTGASPANGAQVPLSVDTFTGGGPYMPRWISEDGNRVFFDTPDALVPQDTNGVWDVYEWERDGTGTCLLNPGCVYLLSGGSSPENSYFLDASADGNDVFFTSREDFGSAAQGETVKAYDARVDGGFASTSTACTGTGCQGVPPAPPSFATPPSATFSGDDNYPPPPLAPASAKKPAPAKSTALSRALKACRKLHKHRRVACETRARAKYAHKTKRGKR
jgi:hypothetical protein